MNDTYKYYLNDSLKQLITMAKEIEITENNDFNNGKLHGYYTAISRLLNQAEAFGILTNLDKEIIDFNPETLLSPPDVRSISTKK